MASKIFVAKRERFDGADIAHVIYGTYGCFRLGARIELVGRTLGDAFVVAAAVSLRLSGADTLCSRGEYGNSCCAASKLKSRDLHPDARFRGSLVDENMFAIDIQ